MRIIFAGTPEFSVPCLEKLIAAKQDVIAVYTQPDRPAGRGRKITESPIKTVAQQHHIPVHQPASLKSAEEQAILKDLKPDLMIVVAYGLILPAAVLTIPRFGCVNVHASLLPRWRGAAPIQRALLAGDIETGITLMQMDEGLDTGDMLSKKTCAIQADDTAETLENRLAILGAELLIPLLEKIKTGDISREKQDDKQTCYATKLSKEEANIRWDLSANEIERRIRAFNPRPIAFTVLDQEIIRIWKAVLLDQTTQSAPGTIIKFEAQGLDVATGDHKILRLLQIQLPGGKVLGIADAFNGKKDLFLAGKTFK